MIESIVSKVRQFRNHLFELFKFRADATMDLIDAIAGSHYDSVVKTSLSSLFRRKYSSITDVLDNLFRCNAEEIPQNLEVLEGRLQLSQLLAEQCPAPGKRGFTLLATDCTAKPRIYSSTVADRTIVHAPNHVPGQKPITVGHEYSLVVYLPETEQDRQAHWSCPLSIQRVQSHETGTRVGFEQIRTLVTKTALQWELCVNVADAAYSTKHCLVHGDSIPNLIQVARLRTNRILYRQAPFIEQKSRGRPACYGESIRLTDPPKPDEEMQLEQITFSGKKRVIRISRWNDLLMKGSKTHRTEHHPFDVVRVQVFDDAGKIVFKKPLWLMIAGQRRRELSLKQAYECYSRRYDIEHCFRFGKQRLLLAWSQTPDTRHEENLAWIVMLSYAMLFHSRNLANEVRYPWEKRRVANITKTIPISQVQRDYERIIREIGTPARIPKPRGKSPGRRSGAVMPKRKPSPIIRKARPMAARC